MGKDELVCWKVGEHGAIIEDRPVDIKDLDETVKFYGGYFVCESVVGKRAKQIAAVPRLLDACRQILHWYEVDSTEFNREMAIGAVRKALAQAGEGMPDDL